MNAMPSPHTLQSLITSKFRLGRQKPRGEVAEVSLKKNLKEHRAYKQDVHNYRQFFAARWRDFIRENFASPAHVAVVFGVTVVTAQNWYDGYNAPQGWAVARAMTDPDMASQASKHLAGGHPCKEYDAD